jgi:hypothetical protein
VPGAAGTAGVAAGGGAAVGEGGGAAGADACVSAAAGAGAETDAGAAACRAPRILNADQTRPATASSTAQTPNTRIAGNMELTLIFGCGGMGAALRTPVGSVGAARAGCAA